MKEKTTRREFNGCLGATVLALLAGGAITGLATSKYLERQRLRASFAEVEREVLEQFKRYATRTPEQIQADASFQDWEKIYFLRENNDIKLWGNNQTSHGPHLLIKSGEESGIQTINFVYNIGGTSYLLDFNRNDKQGILTLNKDSLGDIDTITYFPRASADEAAEGTKNFFRMGGDKKPKYLQDRITKKDFEQIFLLVKEIEGNYQTGEK